MAVPRTRRVTSKARLVLQAPQVLMVRTVQMAFRAQMALPGPMGTALLEEAITPQLALSPSRLTTGSDSRPGIFVALTALRGILVTPDPPGLKGPRVLPDLPVLRELTVQQAPTALMVLTALSGVTAQVPRPTLSA
jgi:hypothetical protein